MSQIHKILLSRIEFLPLLYVLIGCIHIKVVENKQISDKIDGIVIGESAKDNLETIVYFSKCCMREGLAAATFLSASKPIW